MFSLMAQCITALILTVSTYLKKPTTYIALEVLGQQLLCCQFLKREAWQSEFHVVLV